MEKSPRTALSSEALQHMLASCAGLRVVHLARHPVACINSMIASGPQDGADASESDPDRARFCTELWCEAHERILDLANKRHAPPVLLVRGEDVLADPSLELRQIVAWLGIDNDSTVLQAMLHPEASPFANPGPWPSWGDQDPRFLASPALDLGTNEVTSTIPASWQLADDLTRRLGEVAKRLGYSFDRGVET